jgi:hypothetical protein
MTTKYNKWLLNKANGHKVYQIVIKDMLNFNYVQGLAKYTEIGGFCLKINHLPTLGWIRERCSNYKKQLTIHI